jgi:hypothetical protein
MNPKLQSLYSLKFNPLRPDVPVEALYVTPAVDAFLRRVEIGITDGGYVMVTGDPGTGKSVALRLLGKRLAALRDVVVGTIEHPQSRTMDFYREFGDLFAVPVQAHNRWGGFKALRARWTDHIASTLTRPVLILDEAQEALNGVLTELRVLASKELDSRQLLCVVLAGDARLVDRLRSPERADSLPQAGLLLTRDSRRRVLQNRRLELLQRRNGLGRPLRQPSCRQRLSIAPLRVGAEPQQTRGFPRTRIQPMQPHQLLQPVHVRPLCGHGRSFRRDRNISPVVGDQLDRSSRDHLGRSGCDQLGRSERDLIGRSMTRDVRSCLEKAEGRRIRETSQRAIRTPPPYDA